MSYGTAHFTEAEIGNVPAPFQANAQAMATLLESYRARLQGKRMPLTGPFYRSAAVNRAAGGSPNSQHLTASAADFYVSGMSIEAAARAIVAERKAGRAGDFGQLVVHLAGAQHLHMSLPNRVSGKRGEVLVETSKGQFRSWDGMTDFTAGPVIVNPDVDAETSLSPVVIGAGLLLLGGFHG